MHDCILFLWRWVTIYENDFFSLVCHFLHTCCTYKFRVCVGVKVFSSASPTSSPAFKFVNLIFTCTGGGILVPILLNKLPVSIASDYYVIAILTSFVLHSSFPILREVYKASPIIRVVITVMFEVNRTFVLTKFTALANDVIPASTFSFALFGPIFCGAISGCGGAFMPFDKGLKPMEKGLAKPMLTAVVGATCFHLYLNTSLSDGCINAKAKARVHVALFFIAVGLIDTLGFSSNAKKTKKE